MKMIYETNLRTGDWKSCGCNLDLSFLSFKYPKLPFNPVRRKSQLSARFY